MNESLQNVDSMFHRTSHSIGKYDIEIENELIKCRVYWARVIGSETESLFTEYTKHTFYEIQYALEGRIVMLVGENKRITVEQSDFIVIPPDTFHQIVDGDGAGARFIRAFSLDIKDPTLRLLPREISKLLPYHESKYMRELLGIVVGKKYHDDALRRRLVTGYLECFMLEFIESVLPYRAQSAAEIEQMSENEARVARARRFIADFNGIGVAPADVAKRLNISERHLNRIFVSVTGKTLKQEINRRRLGKIEEFVASTALTFREISELCGFSDEYAMNKFFKRYTLYSLTEYRALRA